MNAEPHIFGRRAFNTKSTKGTEPEREGVLHRCRRFLSVLSVSSVLKNIPNQFPNP